MKIKDIIFILIISFLFTWLYLWWMAKDVILDVGPGFCPYPDFIYPLVRPFCMHLWWYNTKVFITSLLSVGTIWMIIKRSYIFRSSKTR